jgi:Intraflagellar transport complex B, subunit 20
MGEDKVHISFDEECRVRVLDPEVFKHSEELEENCRAFATKMTSFNAAVHGIVQVLDSHAERIERQKLRAIGMRNKASAAAASAPRASATRAPRCHRGVQQRGGSWRCWARSDSTAAAFHSGGSG